ncbi:MAG: hypothetical protein JKY92_04190 [Magnetovibrio sp.]|nr:hypothetical protein [Magnetovibrio sp.]
MKRFCVLLAIVLAVLLWASFAFSCTKMDQEIARIESVTTQYKLGHLWLEPVRFSDGNAILGVVVQRLPAGVLAILKTDVWFQGSLYREFGLNLLSQNLIGINLIQIRWVISDER